MEIVLNYRKNQGFTLVEVMLVVAIMGILLSAALPRFAEQLRKSSESSSKASLSILRSALLIYFSDNIGVDVSSFSALVPAYIDEIPEAKMGAYHPNSNAVLNRLALNSTGYDSGGWYYVTPSGAIYANCTHSDTQGNAITSW